MIEISWIHEINTVPAPGARMLAGTLAGLFEISTSGDSATRIPISAGSRRLDGASVYGLVNDSAGTLWFLGRDREEKLEFLARLSPGTGIAEIMAGPFHEMDERYIQMTDLVSTADGRLLIASHHGLYQFNISRPDYGITRKN